MFKSQNFCHIASNNRNQVKVGVFVYRTTDSLETVLTSGYFNDRIIDINLHDLIIHEKIDNTDDTVVERNLLCVVQRSLDNVGTTVIKSALEKEIEDSFVRKDGTSVMSAPLKFSAGSMRGAIAGGLNGVMFFKMDTEGNLTQIGSLSDTQFVPASDNTLDIGTSVRKIERIYLGKVNNGYDINVPVTATTDTLALKSQVDDAANSGEQLYTTGVWYAKMYSSSTVPTGAEYDGRNYADFSQVDGDNNPVIKIYTGVSGAWSLTETITPPATHNGYMTITSKIWDIAEQNGQQGGQVLWSHNQKTFTPYPLIISFESPSITNVSLTGTSTVVMPLNPSGDQIANVDFVLAHAGGGSSRNIGDIFFTSRKDTTLNGAVACDGDFYDTTDFSGSESIGALLEAGKLPYVSLSQYATLLSTNGSVGVFGWDGIGTTQFRVPSLNDVFIESGTSAQVGDYISAGVPNVEGAISGVYFKNSSATGYGPFQVRELVNANLDNTSGSGEHYGNVYYSLAWGNSIYGNSNTVQPNAVRYRAMVQLATESTDTALETCTGVLADVANLKTHDVIEFQAPTAQNNYTWYRKYRDGWVEQGGFATSSQAGTQVNLPITMADSNYSVQATVVAASSNYSTGILTRTTTYFKLTTYDEARDCSWEVKGMAA